VRSARKTGAVITAEEHNVVGGLGSAVAEVLAEHAPTPMRRVGTRDTFTESDDTEILRTAYHLNTSDIVAAAKELVG
jgi:transketolase